MTYDVGVERLNKILKLGRQYLSWVQNSVLEGEITEANLLRLMSQVAKVIDKEADSVTFYILRTTKYLRKKTIGIVKGEPTTIL